MVMVDTQDNTIATLLQDKVPLIQVILEAVTQVVHRAQWGVLTAILAHKVHQAPAIAMVVLHDGDQDSTVTDLVVHPHPQGTTAVGVVTRQDRADIPLVPAQVLFHLAVGHNYHLHPQACQDLFLQHQAHRPLQWLHRPLLVAAPRRHHHLPVCQCQREAAVQRQQVLPRHTQITRKQLVMDPCPVPGPPVHMGAHPRVIPTGAQCRRITAVHPDLIMDRRIMVARQCRHIIWVGLAARV